MLFTVCCMGTAYPWSANADPEDIKYGADLERLCNSTVQQEQTECAAYLAVHLATTRVVQQRASYCIFYDAPKDLALEAGVKILTDWLREHRDRGEIEASFVVNSAMKDTFPCKN